MSAAQNTQVTHDRFAPIAVTRSLDSTNAQNAAHLVDHQSGQRFAVDVFSDDQQRLLRLADRFQKRNEFLVAANFLFENQHVAIVELNSHFVWVGNEMRRQKAAIKLHAFNNFNSCFSAAALFDGDHAVFANFQERVSQDVADGWIVVTSDSSNLLDFSFALLVDLDRHLRQLVAHGLNRFSDSAR